MPAPLIPILARLAMGLARSGAVRGALGTAARTGSARTAPAMTQRLAGAGRRTAQKGTVSRRFLASLGRRRAARDAARAVLGRTSATRRSNAGQLLALKQQLAASRASMNARLNAISTPPAGAAGGPQGPPPPPPPGQPGGPQGPPPPPSPPVPAPQGPPPNPALPQARQLASSFAKLAGVVGTAVTAIAGYALSTEKLTRLLAEQRRELAPYSGQISAAFSRLEVQDLRSRIRTARETSGTTSSLVNAVREQHRSMEQMNRDIASINNMLGIANAYLAKVIGDAYSVARELGGWGPLLDLIEKNTRKEQGGANTPTRKMLAELLSPNFQPRDRNPLPPIQ